jgi:hypothetical protein
MAFAPHTNNNVVAQLRAGIVPTPVPLILGDFTEREYEKIFQYAERRWHDDECYPDLPHMIYVGDGQTRIGRVHKTIAWVLCSTPEDEPDLQRWEIKKHRQYDTAWVRA